MEPFYLYDKICEKTFVNKFFNISKIILVILFCLLFTLTLHKARNKVLYFQETPIKFNFKSVNEIFTAAMETELSFKLFFSNKISDRSSPIRRQNDFLSEIRDSAERQKDSRRFDQRRLRRRHDRVRRRDRSSRLFDATNFVGENVRRSQDGGHGRAPRSQDCAKFRSGNSTSALYISLNSNIKP